MIMRLKELETTLADLIEGHKYFSPEPLKENKYRLISLKGDFYNR